MTDSESKTAEEAVTQCLSELLENNLMKMIEKKIVLPVKDWGWEIDLMVVDEKEEVR